MNIETTETHITDVLAAELTVFRTGGATKGEEFFLGDPADPSATLHPIPRYLYDAIMRHHREVGS